MIAQVAKGMREVDRSTFGWFVAQAHAKQTPYANGILFHDAQARLVAQIVDGRWYVKVKVSKTS